MDLLTGGDLRYHICKHRRFTEEQTSKFLSTIILKEFFVASMIMALEYVHSKNIIHRDIKPENLVFDSEGYLCTTDFGIARVLRPENH